MSIAEIYPEGGLPVQQPDPEKNGTTNDPMGLDSYRGQKISAMLMEEFQYNRDKRIAMQVEARMVADTLNYRGQYGSAMSFDEFESDVFFQRTHERCQAAIAKILQIANPMQGNAWSLQVSRIPHLENEGVDPEAARQAMEAKLQDAMEYMDFNALTEDVVFNMVVKGTGIVRAPMVEKERYSRLSRLPGYKKSDQYPIAKSIDPLYVYPDPHARSVENCSNVIIRHVLTEAQLKILAKCDGFDPEMVDKLLEKFPNGNYTSEPWEIALNLHRDQKRFIVFERWGYVDKNVSEDWGITDNFDAVFETWSCGHYTLKHSAADFYSECIPIYFVPYMRMDHGLFGKGVAGMMREIQMLLCVLARSLEDDLSWSLAPQVIGDMNQIGPAAGNDDLTPRPRKFWKFVPNELSGKGRPVDFFLIPSNLPNIMKAWEFLESQLPIVTCMPMLEDPKDAGSGMRTVGQMQIYYETAFRFIKLVIGNLDRRFIEPIVRDLYEWFMLNDPDDKIKGDFNIVPLGVRGAIRKEILAQKAMQLNQLLTNSPFQDVANSPTILQAIVEGMEVQDEHFVLTPEELAAKQKAEAAALASQSAEEAAAKLQAETKVRAETSRADAILQLAKSTPDTNPTWGAQIQAAYESLGAATPQLYAGLRIWAMEKAAELAAQAGNPQQQQDLEGMQQGLTPKSPLDLDPQYRPHGTGNPADVPGAPQPTQPITSPEHQQTPPNLPPLMQGQPK